MERWSGDKKFRLELERSESLDELATRFGLEVDFEILRPLYDAENLEETRASGTEPAPSVSLWHRYSELLHEFRDGIREAGGCLEANPRFHAWRRRQIHRVESECGRSGKGIVHPVVAFELADGCSVGCWFCGISADKFNGHWPYSVDNAELWRGVLQALSAELGPALQSGFLYWATDPLDNPDYASFLRDFLDETGVLPQTTTAIPLRNVELTREVMALFEEHRHVINRFSVLTTKILDRIHETFDAREMLGVELVLQMKDSNLAKSLAGRARERNLRRARPEEPVSPEIEAATIACVSGFLVNMPKRTIRLVAPCRPSDRWPDGYKIWATRTFHDIESFRDEIRSLIEDHVDTRPKAEDPIRFREDLEFQPTGTGFKLVGLTRIQDVKGPAFTARVGELIAAGHETHRSLRAKMIQEGTNPLALEILLEQIYDQGLLAEPVDRLSVAHRASEANLVVIGSTEGKSDALAFS